MLLSPASYDLYPRPLPPIRCGFDGACRTDAGQDIAGKKMLRNRAPPWRAHPTISASPYALTG